MLVKCPECELQISDKAISCPHCGLPMGSKRPSNPKKSHKRLPNGFGQISLITSKPLRNPYRAMVTVGRNSNGRPVCRLLKPVCYFPTYNAAYEALVEYNKNPYDLDSSITIEELYEKWSVEYFKKITESSKRTITAAWAYCDPIKHMQVKSVRSRHIKGLMDNEKISINTRNRMKSMFNLMLDYAVEYEICDKNYARDFNIAEKPINVNHISYTDEEMDVLWDNQDNDIVSIMLIQCYSGLRPSELFSLQFDWEQNIMIGGSKTEAGKNRIVPIHPKIYELAKKRESLLNSLTYDAYFKKYKATIKALKLDSKHKPHDGRKTFITLAKKYNVDEYAIKRLVGHAIDDITEKVYTDRDIDWLRTEIDRIK